MSTSTTTTALPAAALQRRLPTVVHLPGSAEYEALTLAWDRAVTQTPAAVAEPRTAEEVAQILRVAVELGLRVAPQTTGHAAAPLAQNDFRDVVLLRTGRLREVHVDPVRRTAMVGGGALWSDVLERIAEHGLAALHGSAADVGVVGYLLGGGLSFYGRHHGLATTSVVSVELVTSIGEVVRVDALSDPDLFWALRGGVGANFGVVTAVEIALFPLTSVHAGMLLWEIGHADPVVRTWVNWTRTAPESITTSLRIMRFPAVPDLPLFLSGRRVVVIDGAVLGTGEEADRILAPLRELAPEMDTFAELPTPALVHVHMDPPAPTPTVGQGALLDDLDEEGMRTLLREVGPSADSPLMFAELRQLGGAIGRAPADPGALTSLPGSFAMYAVALAPVPPLAVAGLAAARRLRQAMLPWTIERSFPNFNHGESPAGSAYETSDLVRLRVVRERLDPERVMVAHHAIH